MYVDLLNSDNYISINLSLIKLLGLSGAAYVSELLNICKKAITKNKMTVDGYVTVNRKYIESRISLSASEQREVDTKLASLDLALIKADNKDMISVNIPGIVSLIAEFEGTAEQLNVETVTTVKKIFEQTTNKESKAVQAKIIAKVLKKSVVNFSPKIKQSVFSWIDTIIQDSYLSKEEVTDFQNKLYKYTKDELIAIKIVDIAIKNKFVSFDLAVHKYEQECKTAPRCTLQKRSTREDMEKGIEF